MGRGALQPRSRRLYPDPAARLRCRGLRPLRARPLAKATVLAGTWAEFILPALVVLGLFTRIAALGMIGFVLVLTWVDIMGHGAGPETIGAWFNNTSGDAILDQRAFWIFLLIVLTLRGAGSVSLDALLGRYRSDDLHRRVPAEVKRPAPSRSPAASSARDERPTDRGSGRARSPPTTRARSWSACSAADPRRPRETAPAWPRPAASPAHPPAPRRDPRPPGPNRLPAGIAVAQSVDLHDARPPGASFFNDLRKLAPSPRDTSNSVLSNLLSRHHLP
jgi:uncharacterized membrane protein YphA (DoxX/SURF4 family)